MKIKEIKKIIHLWFKKKKISVKDNENLLRDEILDSFDIIEFISFLEKEFSIKFDNVELQNIDLFYINKLSEIVKKKKNV